jgi:hypothetical protein
MVKTSRGAFLSSLSDAANGLEVASSCADKFINEYPSYKDISATLSNPYGGTTEKAIKDFSRAINGLPQTLPADYDLELRAHAGKLKVEMNNLANWIDEIRTIVDLKIRELSGRR